MSSPAPRLLLVAALLSSAPLRAEQRLDHRGAMGLLLGSQLEARSVGGGAQSVSNTWAYGPELGLTVALGYHGNELKTMVRPSLGGQSIDWSLLVGYRGYFGEDEVKTFLDLDVVGHLSPDWAVGPRIGFGLQYELSPVVGVYTSLGVQVGFGSAFRFGTELSVGVQLRSYLLE